jgi:hypothetical protein
MIHTLRTRQNKSMSEFVEEALTYKPGAVFPVDDQLAPGHKAVARIDYGRWIVDCPFCPNAVLLDPTEPRTFCLNCYNERAEYQWVGVVMPDAEERAAIEEALDDGRPEHEMTWTPGQTVKDLRDGAPVQGPELSPAYLLESAERAWAERDEVRGRIAQLEEALTTERRGALLLVRLIEQRDREKANLQALLDQEREFAKHIASNAPQQAHTHERN